MLFDPFILHCHILKSRLRFRVGCSYERMSSEKFELAQDELESLLERLQGEVGSLASAQGEARKRAIQVWIDYHSNCTDC